MERAIDLIVQLKQRSYGKDISDYNGTILRKPFERILAVTFANFQTKYFSCLYNHSIDNIQIPVKAHFVKMMNDAGRIAAFSVIEQEKLQS